MAKILRPTEKTTAISVRGLPPPSVFDSHGSWVSLGAAGYSAKNQDDITVRLGNANPSHFASSLAKMRSLYKKLSGLFR